MVARNRNFQKLGQHYLFQEIGRRKQQFLAKNPSTKLIPLGIGDTTEPIPISISHALETAARQLGTREGYEGYGPEQGMEVLRKKIAHEWYQSLINPQEVFISDGAKCDIGRLQILFGSQATIAIQDPAYPVYVDSSVIAGRTGRANPSTGEYEGIAYLPSLPSQNFFPDLNKTPATDLIVFCSPNNPTGAVATRDQLLELVKFAEKNGSIIIFDSAYSPFIQDSSLPRSIFEIPRARNVAIEVNSFSKIAGFTGIRLGWTVVPEELKFDDGSSVRADWARLMGTVFNGASNIAQYGGIAVLNEEGLQETRLLINFYLENARLIRMALESKGYRVYGGDNAPYVWGEFPGQKSWDVFQHLLEKAHLVATPGSGFGPAGEGFMRFSAFGSRATILEAAQAIAHYL